MNENVRNDPGISRRALIGATLSASITVVPARSSAAPGAVKAIAFDAFAMFDPRPITALIHSHYPQRGEALATVWSAKLFDYTWLCTAANRYEHFDSLADASLRFAAESTQLSLPDQIRAALVLRYSQLDVWPDVKPTIETLRTAGVRLGLLSNLRESALRANLRNADIAGAFEQVLSTDRVQRFKPAPAAYHMAVEAFGLAKDEIGFAAFAGWDAAGASWFGYRTAWVNRFGAPAERLRPSPAIVSRGIESALALAGLA